MTERRSVIPNVTVSAYRTSRFLRARSRAASVTLCLDGYGRGDLQRQGFGRFFLALRRFIAYYVYIVP